MTTIITKIFVIDGSSIININRLIDIDYHRLLSIVIDCPGPATWIGGGEERMELARLDVPLIIARIHEAVPKNDKH